MEQKRITIVNMKGGVGKTTLSVNISYVLARFHYKKVLLIDVDPQFNATQYLVNQKNILEHFKDKKTIYDILLPNKEENISLSGNSAPKKTNQELKNFIINIGNYENSGRLDLLPSSLKLINFETTKRGIENHLKNFINSKCKEYDFIIFDCPPTLSILSLSAYLASTHYLIPIKPDYLSSLGLPLLERGLKEYEETYGHSLNPIGVVFTMVQNTSSLPAEIKQSILSSGKRKIFRNSVSQTVKIARSIENNINSINDFYNNSNFTRYAIEFKKIVDELIDEL